MDPKKLFVDERLKGVCTYCGAEPDSRDHVPSRVFLDKPYPENLPVVESCSKCNKKFSVDEEYLACFLECVIQDTTEPNENFREKIANTLQLKPSIRKRISKSKNIDEYNNVIWQPEIERVKNVVLKLARGHIAYELGIQHFEEPIVLDMLPIPLFSKEQLTSFNSQDDKQHSLHPEIGSRAFINLLTGNPTAYENWFTVQNGLYRYTLGQSNGDWVKFVISEYLACRVVWE